MRTLGTKFPEKQHLQISDLADATNLEKSRVSRAALQIGLKAIREAYGEGYEEAMKLVLLEDAKSLN